MSFAVAAVATMGAGAMMSAVGAQKNAQAQKATLGYEAAVARNNQTIANYQADITLQNGAIAEQTQQLKAAALKGDQRAAMAANGIDLSEGSATEVLATTDYMGHRDALTIRDNAARQAWATREQAKGYGSEAAADVATSDAINPNLALTSSLISGAGQVAGSWYSYNRARTGK